MHVPTVLSFISRKYIYDDEFCLAIVDEYSKLHLKMDISNDFNNKFDLDMEVETVSTFYNKTNITNNNDDRYAPGNRITILLQKEDAIMFNHHMNLFIIALIMIWVISRQLRPRKVKMITLFLLPLLALYQTVQNLPHSSLPVYQIVEFVFITVAAMLGGIVQAKYTRVFWSGDQLYMQGNKITLFAWIALIVIRYGLNFTFHAFFAPAGSPLSVLWILWVGIAIMFSTRNLLMYRKWPEIRNMVKRRSEA